MYQENVFFKEMVESRTGLTDLMDDNDILTNLHSCVEMCYPRRQDFFLPDK